MARARIITTEKKRARLVRQSIDYNWSRATTHIPEKEQAKINKRKELESLFNN